MQNPNTDEVHCNAKGGAEASRSIGGQQSSCFCDHVCLSVILSLFALIYLLIYLSRIFKIILYELPRKSRLFTACFFCSLG